MPKKLVGWIGVAAALCTSACADRESLAVGKVADSANSAIEAGGSDTERLVEFATTQSQGGPPRGTATKRKSTADLVSSGGVNTVSAYGILDAPNFEEKVSQVAAEGADVSGALEATFALQKSLAGLVAAIDPQAQIGRVACNGDVCVTSVQSSMDKAQWEAWKAEFARSKSPSRSATIYSSALLQDGSTAYRMLIVTKPGSNGINIPFQSIPSANQLRQQGQLKPKR